jgi:hypothetical protein
MPEITTVSDPHYANAANTLIDCIVTFSDIGGPYPFTASPNDSVAYGKELFAALQSGLFGPIGAYVPPPPPKAKGAPHVIA